MVLMLSARHTREKATGRWRISGDSRRARGSPWRPPHTGQCQPHRILLAASGSRAPIRPLGVLDHRRCESWREDESTRRREIGRRPLVDEIEIDPSISSPLTVSSPSAMLLGPLNRNTSPAIVPSRGPEFAPPDSQPEPDVNRIYPLTADPCWSSSNQNSFDAPDLPYQVPVTSTVTSVRSIQSVDAQPEPNASAPAMSTQVTALMLSAHPRARGDGSARADRAGCTASPCTPWPRPPWPSPHLRPGRRR